MTPRRKRSHEESDASSDTTSEPPTASPTEATTDTPTQATTEAPEETEVSRPRAKTAKKLLKPRKPRTQAAESYRRAQENAHTRKLEEQEELERLTETAGGEQSLNWPELLIDRYKHQKQVPTCDRCRVKNRWCNQDPNGCSACVKANIRCTVTDKVSHVTWERGNDIPMNIAAADAQLLAKLTAAVEERDLLREQVRRDPNARELSRVLLENQRLQRENERMQRSLSAFTGNPVSTDNPPRARPANNSNPLPASPANNDNSSPASPTNNNNSSPATPANNPSLNYGSEIPPERLLTAMPGYRPPAQLPPSRFDRAPKAARLSDWAVSRGDPPLPKSTRREPRTPTKQASSTETPPRQDTIIDISHAGLKWKKMNIGKAKTVEEFANNLLTKIGLPVPEWVSPARPNNGRENAPAANPATLPAFAQPPNTQSPVAPQRAESAEPETASAQQASEQPEDMDWSVDGDNAAAQPGNDDENFDEEMRD
ncbi:putative C6 finger domain protein [Aspergillus mulundensis]|uniref:Zn(2)-C6 fungal-type domain-containing protein n=1 Tax=Aspergillus mulundensis TaxID=1810919 RepID=A0A3D8Q6Z4_9EURO|nr:hypothetical protein DSM5745_11464 [Aspergillus mulundensis]RDW57569.1 hypothetical protein DSM5745_11464 [Aspergillus mulundensis]